MIHVRYIQLLTSLAASVQAHNVSRLFDEGLWSDIEQSPLRVELRSAANGVQVTLTNTGTEAAYWPLSTEDLSSHLQIYTANDEPAARMTSAHAHEKHNTTYQLLPPGASETRELEILTDYNLQPGEQYYLQMGGFMPYYLANQNPSLATSQSHIFEADIAPFTAPTHLPSKRYTDTPATAGVATEACADPDMDAKLKKAIPQALLQAMKAIEYVETGKDRTTMQNFFKSDSAETRKVVSDRLKAIVEFLSSKTTTSKIVCSSVQNSGATNHRNCILAGAVAMTDPNSGKVSMCPAAKRYPVQFKACGDSNWGGTLIHELTHSRAVFTPVTTDITYALNGCKGLSRERALLNANNFNFLADSVMLGKSC
ncbi:hypothetical protein E2P81_ATG03816 [Venturia nashicola]|nr:hypothetical protein E2P81_ATG03816 [Venturia nashicola]